MLRFFNKIKNSWLLNAAIERFQNISFYLLNRITSFFKNDSSDIKISFFCGFHGKTGAVESIANIANALSNSYQVEFHSFPTSNFNCKLKSSVKIVGKLDFNSTLFFCDVSCAEDDLKKIRDLNKPILMSVHGMLNSQFGLSAEEKLAKIKYASIAQFVSAVQRDEYPIADSRAVVIPNFVKAIRKNKFTYNAGTVGNLNLVNKNADKSVEIVLHSNLAAIHLWSLDEDKWLNDRVVVHSWNNDREKIYNSFDVLVFMSEEEALAMSVIEAMSCGIPCLLSNIPAFEQLSHVPGIRIIDPNDVEYASEELTVLMSQKQELAPQMQKHWETYYSEEAIAKQWLDTIEYLINESSSFVSSRHS